MSKSKSIISCKNCFSDCILCTSLYMFCAFYIIFLIYIPFTIYIIYLLGKNFDKNNVLWYNILISTISNYSCVFCNKKKKCEYIYSLNSTINGLLATTTLILTEHYYINDVLYNIAIIEMITQYFLVLFNLLILYYHYTCNFIC